MRGGKQRCRCRSVERRVLHILPYNSCLQLVCLCAPIAVCSATSESIRSDVGQRMHAEVRAHAVGSRRKQKVEAGNTSEREGEGREKTATLFSCSPSLPSGQPPVLFSGVQCHS
ncbi:hypothetical protein GOODEAATRI_001549 [Goodea atripinnis]|uniref:Uncharacterized protein n=1 Tax=Goodea atripinnis TaxID=208336 RepID=A0ABV0MNE9_9TELE